MNTQSKYHKVQIYESLDTLDFIAERNGDNLILKNIDNTPISSTQYIIDGVWSNIKESLINDYDITNKIDEGCELFLGLCDNNNSKQRIVYDMSNVKKYTLYNARKYGKYLDKACINNIAESLDFGNNTLFFDGYISEHENKYLHDFSKGLYEHNTKGYNLATYIKNNICDTYSKNEYIKGVKVLFENVESTLDIYSLEYDILSNVKNESTLDIPTDLVSFLSEHVNSKDLYELFNECCDKGYFESISNAELTSYRAKFYQPLNESLIENETTKGLITDINVKYKDCLRLFLEYCDNKLVNEAETNILVNNITKRREAADVDYMRIISSVQNTFCKTTLYNEAPNGKENVIVYVSNFSPFNASDSLLLEKLHKQYNARIVICHLSTVNSIESDEYRVSDNLVKAQMKSIRENVEYVASAITIKNDSITEIFGKCRPDYEPILIACTNNSSSDYINQLYYYEQVKGDELHVFDNFNIIEEPNGDNLRVLRAIEDENSVVYKELTPSYLHWTSPLIFNEYKIWIGSILNNSKQ